MAAPTNYANVQGQTLLEAVNMVLQAGGVKPVANVVTTPDGSQEYQAYLDIETVRRQTLVSGYGRVLLNQTLAPGTGSTADAPGGTWPGTFATTYIFVDGTAGSSSETNGPFLHVRPANESRHRSVAIYYTEPGVAAGAGYSVLYDIDNDTFDFTGNLVVDAIPDDSFLELPPAVKELVTARARRRHQMSTRRNLAMDAVLASEVAAIEQSMLSMRYPVDGSVSSLGQPVRISEAMLRSGASGGEG